MELNSASHTIEYNNTKPISVVLVMVCIYIFLFIERPWESISLLHGYPIERVFAILMIIMAFVHHKFKIVTSPTNKWVYALLLLHFVLAPFAFDTGDAVDQGIEYAKMVVLYLLMLSVADDENGLKMLIMAYVFSTMFYAIHSLWEYHNGRHFFRMGIHRMLGVGITFSDPNAFGASVVYCLPFVYALFKTEPNVWLRRLYCCYFPLAVVCVVLTGSRTASVALLFLLLMWCLAQNGKRKFFALISAVAVIFVVWSVMPSEKQERIRSLWDEEAGPVSAHQSADGRKVGFKVSWKMFTQAPFTGVGAGGKNFIGYRMAHGIDEDGQASPTESHVLYGQILAGLGVSGALFFAGLIVTTFRCCSQARSQIQKLIAGKSFVHSLGGAIIVGLLLLLLFGLGGHNFYRPQWLWLAAWAGALYKLAGQGDLISSLFYDGVGAHTE